jgi:hypothetical protein
MSLPALNPSGHIYFSTMPIVKKTFIIDEDDNKIEVEAGKNHIAIHLKMYGIEAIPSITLSIEDAKSLMMMLDDEITKVQKNQS